MIGQISPETKLSRVKTFYDYRRMFDAMHKDIDAVFIAVPDHHHATAAMIAMSLGKAVYLEKPMAHSIDEVRRLTAARGSTRWSRSWATRGTAARASAACASISGPGPSATSTETLQLGADRPRRRRRAAAHQAGARRIALGRVDRPGTLPRLSRQAASRGMADMVGVWRRLGWRLGLPQPRWAVHGLWLGARQRRSPDAEGGSDERYPLVNAIRWDFPARGDMPPVKVFWYDGYRKNTDSSIKDEDGKPAKRIQNRPPIVAELEKKYGRDFKDGGTIYVGDKGIMFSDNWTKSARIVPEEKQQAFHAAGEEAEASEGDAPARFPPRLQGRSQAQFQLR